MLEDTLIISVLYIYILIFFLVSLSPNLIFKIKMSIIDCLNNNCLKILTFPTLHTD